MPPFVIVAVATVGAIAAAKWLKAEARRVNAELQAIRDPSAAEGDPGENAASRKTTARETLHRDPVSGVYRPN